MKVYEVMTIDAGFCSSDDNLTKAAEIMRQKDCGIVPVIDAEKRVIGVITDRDICLAAAESSKKLSGTKAHELNSGNSNPPKNKTQLFRPHPGNAG